MKYIIEFEDEPCMREDGLNFYKCIQVPWYQLSDMVIKRLTPYEPEQARWIPCSERLPKERQPVLVTDGSVCEVCEIIRTDRGYMWMDCCGERLDFGEWWDAWQTLPVPYKGGDSE